MANSILGLLGIGVSILLLLLAFLGSYILQVVLRQTSVEVPSADGESWNMTGYQIAPAKDDLEDISESAGLTLNEHDPVVTSRGLTICSLRTRSICSALANLVNSAGLFGLFRAIPAQLCYLVIHDALCYCLRGGHPVTQILSRTIYVDRRYNFSPALIIATVLIKIILIPVDLVITRQIIGKPDKTTFIGLCRSVVNDLGIIGLAPMILPQILCYLVPTLLHNLATWLHFLLLEDFAAIHPGWLALIALFELCWQIFVLVFVSAPLALVLYQAHASGIAMLPPFDAFVSFSPSYKSPIAALRSISAEERNLGLTWHSRYLRYARVVALSSVLVFCNVTIGVSTLVGTGWVKY